MRSRRFVAALLALVAASGTSLAQCFEWASGFSGAGVSNSVLAQVVFDDGSGPALYVAGRFKTAGPAVANHIARWDGASWSSLGAGVAGGALTHVSSLCVFDDGGGPALYAAGSFTSAGGVAVTNIAKWNGVAWSDVGGGLNLQGGPEFTDVHALAVFDGGAGPELFAGGWFDDAGGMNVSNLAKWNGSSWSQVGGAGANNPVRALLTYDDGSGTQLYAAGDFTQVGATTALEHVARWDGSSWTSFGGTFFSQPAAALAAHDDGSGTALYVSRLSGGVERWNGSSWSQVGALVTGSAYSLASFDEGAGVPRLYAGGTFLFSGALTRLMRWDGVAWSAPAPADQPDNEVSSLAVFDSGAGEELCAGGAFRKIGAAPADYLARWDGAAWSTFSVPNSVDDQVVSLGVYDSGGGAELYVGGDFARAASSSVYGVCRWNGSTFSDVAGSMPPGGPAHAFKVWGAGGGAPSLHVGGRFLFAGGVQVNKVGRWDGSAWHALGAGVHSGPGREVLALEVFGSGSSEHLYAAGTFDQSIGAIGNRIARWNGLTWNPLGSGLDQAARALCTSSVSGAPLLYVGGDFSLAGGVPASRLASWDGASFAPVGGGLSGDVLALAEFDDGSGKALFVAGEFVMAGGVLVNRIARWDGVAWSALGAGCDDTVRALCVFDDGLGPALYAGGDFTTAGGVLVNHIARWDGAQWSALGAGTDARVRALQVYDDGSGPALFAGGAFTSAGGKPSLFFAKWGAACPCPPASYCTAKVNSQGCTPSIFSTGSSSIASNSLRVKASNVINNKSGILFWGFAPNAAPFQGGTLCVQAPTIRTPAQSSGGNAPPDDCSGAYSFHFNASYMSGQGIAPGARIYCQYWSRDPASPSTTGLTDALFFTTCP